MRGMGLCMSRTGCRDVNKITADIVDAAIKIHKGLGPGLLESVYEEVLAAELERRGHIVERQKDITFEFDGLRFDKGFRIDLLIDELVVLELKSSEKMNPVYQKQLKTYLVLMELNVGLLLNFGMGTMVEGMRRVVNNLEEE